MVSAGVVRKKSGVLLEAPSCFHRRHASSNQTDTDHNATHPHMRTQSGHDEIGRQIKDHIADIEKCEACRDLMLIQMQHTCKVVARVLVHCLCQTNVRTDGRTHEIDDPEGGNDAPVKFADEKGQCSVQIVFNRCCNYL